MPILKGSVSRGSVSDRKRSSVYREVVEHDFDAGGVGDDLEQFERAAAEVAGDAVDGEHGPGADAQLGVWSQVAVLALPVESADAGRMPAAASAA